MAEVGRTELQPGDRARHRNTGWGTILEARPQQDGSAEYKVQRDQPIVPGTSNEPTWWPSYHLAEWESHDPCPTCGEKTEDPYGGPCSACWERVS